MTDPTTPASPREVEHHLRGVRYPTTKSELARAAQRNEAPDAFVEDLQQLPERWYSGPEDVLRSYRNEPPPREAGRRRRLR